MFSEKFKEVKSRWLIIVGLLSLLPLCVFIINLLEPNSLLSQDDKFYHTPTLKEQPVDTRVSSTVLPLHHWRTDSKTDVYFVPTEQPAIINWIRKNFKEC